ncbi:MAG TPA: hypothetical protein VFG76_03060 [Candidatus Polarisedimenticolia bacterium]|nr:hypothetical protein [Candidatus Polarisedimenticolia bacterium]
MAALAPKLAALVLLAHLFVYSCDDDDDDIVFVEDVSVDVTGDAGTDFDARFEDDDDLQTLSGTVPFSVDFERRIGFFHATVDKESGGDEQICVRVAAGHESKQSCTSEPFGRVSVTIVF